MARRVGRKLRRGAGEDDGAAVVPGARAHVDEPVGVGGDVEVVLDDDDVPRSR